MKKVLSMLAFLAILISMISIPGSTSGEGDDNCVYFADYSWNPNTGRYNDLCPLFNGPDYCTVPCGSVNFD